MMGETVRWAAYIQRAQVASHLPATNVGVGRGVKVHEFDV